MIRRATYLTAFSLLPVLLVAGCKAQPKSQNRVGTLQKQNATLTGQLNQAYGDLESAMRERDDFNNRLSSAIRDAEALRIQLADQPDMQQAPPGWTAVPGGAMIAIEGNVLFAPGKVVLRKEARQALNSIASTIEGEYGAKDIIVFGHTDNAPIKKSGWKDNWQLSSERALSVVRFLHGRGIDASRLAASGCGEFRPRVPNSSEPNRTTNRRVEIFAIDAQPRTGRTP